MQKAESIMKSKQNGFTLIETLLSLYVSLLVSMLALLLIVSVYHIYTSRYMIQVELAILQLRQRCALATCHVQEGVLILDINHEAYQIRYAKHRLVKQPGYEIWMENIDGAIFYKENKGIYLTIDHQGTKQTYQIYEWV